MTDDRIITAARTAATQLRAFLADQTGTDGGRHDHLLATIDTRVRDLLGVLAGLPGPAPLIDAPTPAPGESPPAGGGPDAQLQLGDPHMIRTGTPERWTPEVIP